MKKIAIAALFGAVSAINFGKKDADLCTPVKKLGTDPLQGAFFERYKMNGKLFDSFQKYWVGSLKDAEKDGGGFYDWNVVKKLDKGSIEISAGWLKEEENVKTMKNCLLEEHSIPSAGERNITMWTLKHKDAPATGKVPIISLTHGGAALFGNAYQN